MTTRVEEGGCLCGAIRYRVCGEPTATSLCHCQSCRRASGAPSVAWAVFRQADFSIVSGTPVKFRSSPPVTRTFCATCGTPLTYEHESSAGKIDITTATLDWPAAFPPACEIWVAEKIAWETLNPSLAQHQGSSKPPR